MADFSKATIGHFARHELLRYAEQKPEDAALFLEVIETAIKKSNVFISTLIERPNGDVELFFLQNGIAYEVYNLHGTITLMMRLTPTISLLDGAIRIRKADIPTSAYLNLKAKAIGSKLSQYIELDRYDLDALAPAGITKITEEGYDEDIRLVLSFKMPTYPYTETAAEIRAVIAQAERMLSS